MDKATVVGLLVAVLMVIGAVFLGPAPIVFVNVQALLIVGGGSLGVLIMQFTFGDIKNLINVLKVAFKEPDFDDPRELIQKFKDLSNISRREGILALEKQNLNNDFMKKGINYCVDGAEAEKIEDIMTKEIDFVEERHGQSAQMLDSLKEYAPAFGMMGTLIGLVQMLNNMDDPKSIGPAMAVALLTTLYGAFIANAVAGPLKSKLDLRTAQELVMRQIIRSGVLAIHHGENPRLLGETLETFLPPSEREAEEE